MTTSSATSVSLASLGLGSGLNDAQIITGLVTAMEAPATAMQTAENNEQSASSSISAFSADLSSLQQSAFNLSDPTQYASYAATSSSSSVVATASAGATAGSYDVQVNQLAQAQLTYSDTQSTSTDGLGMSGTLGITVGGQTYNVSVGSGDSLATIAQNIDSSGAPVTASVVFDGTSYRLQVQGNSPGASNAIAFNESGFSLGLSNADNTYQSAQDAKLTVNGIAVTSSSNQVTGAIPGVSLALTSTTSSPTTITVASNASGIESMVSSFVTAYNTMVSTGHTDTGYASTPAANSVLQGDQGIEAALDQVSSIIAESVPGASPDYPNLASVGITLNNDGSLSFNQSTFQAAVQADPTGVSKLFVTDPSSGATGAMGALSTVLTSLVGPSGTLEQETKMFNSQAQSKATAITALQAQGNTYQATLEAEFTSMEESVQNEKTLFQALGGTGTFV